MAFRKAHLVHVLRNPLQRMVTRIRLEVTKAECRERLAAHLLDAHTPQRDLHVDTGGERCTQCSNGVVDDSPQASASRGCAAAACVLQEDAQRDSVGIAGIPWRQSESNLAAMALALTKGQ